MSAAIVDQIPQIVRRHIEAGEVRGGITLFARGGEVLMIDAQGADGEGDSRPLAPDSVFTVYSMTKPVTATAAAILVEEGRLSPSDPVSRYIPEFAKPRRVRKLRPGHNHRPLVFSLGDPRPKLDMSAPEPEFDYEPAHRPITVHDIMSFTSGLQTIGIPNPSLPETTAEDTIASYVAKLGDATLEFQPGSQWHYSNSTGYEVLARIIEVASETPFDRFVQQRLFDPLGMADACFGRQPKIKDRVISPGPFDGGRTSRVDYASGSAGLYASAENYWRFAQMLLGEGEFQGRRIMPASAVRLMRTNQIGDIRFPGVRSVEYSAREPASYPGVRYGYGLALVVDQPTAGTDLPNGSFGWDGVGTRRFWGIPSLDAVLIMLMPGLGLPADATHREIERAVASLAG